MGKRGPKGPSGATAGIFAVKSCGEAHAWCTKCHPEMARRPKREPRPPRPCGYCGLCDTCLGLTAPDGMKVCRRCGQTKPLSAFPMRSAKEQQQGRAGSGYRGQCKTCREELQMIRLRATVSVDVTCEVCGKAFMTSFRGTRVCLSCREASSRACRECGKQFVGHSSRYFCSSECLSLASKRGRKQQRDIERMEALNIYGGDPSRCTCCGESENSFLALDHINGGGTQHRREAGGGGFWGWLKRQNYPSGFQVLCHNCNYGRYLNGGTCPHKKRI